MSGANADTVRIFEEMARLAPELGVATSTLSNGARVVDAGVSAPGSTEAGLLAARVTLGERARVELRKEGGRTWVHVESEDPALATLGCQFAAWMVPMGDSRGMASGPGRILARKPKLLYEKLGLSERSDVAVFFLEADRLPTPDVADFLARGCGLEPRALRMVVAPPASPAGLVQICSRALENGMLRLYNEGFPVGKIRKARGRAPLAEPPPGKDPVPSLNDNIRFSGEATAEVEWSPPEELEGWAARAVTAGTPEEKKPFARILEEAMGDFRNIAVRVFSPAKFTFVETRSGKRFGAGKI
ncbi:MAG: methenyltetrahydromethanopterin cyclohydrolase [Halobacteria archaeon]